MVIVYLSGQDQKGIQAAGSAPATLQVMVSTQYQKNGHHML